MNNALEKLSSYQLLTNLIPGMFFAFIVEYILNISFIPSDTLERLIVFYFIGLIISRVGSLIVEPILRKINFVSYTQYSDFLKASKLDTKLEVLVETNNFFRSLLTCFLLLPVAKLYILIVNSWAWLKGFWYWPIVISCLIIFLFSFHKQSAFICKRVNAAIKNHAPGAPFE